MRTRAPLTSRAPSPTTSTFATSRATSALGASTRLQRAPQRVKPRIAHRTTGLPHGTWPAWPSPTSANLRATVSAGPVPMPSRLFVSDAQATTAATTARASALSPSLQPCHHRQLAITRAACTMRASAVQRSSTTPQSRYLPPRPLIFRTCGSCTFSPYCPLVLNPGAE